MMVLLIKADWLWKYTYAHTYTHTITYVHPFLGFPGGTSDKEPTYQCRRQKRHGFDLWVGMIPWRKPQQPAPGFLPKESHGQRSLAGYSPWGSQRVGPDWTLDTFTFRLYSGTLSWNLQSDDLALRLHHKNSYYLPNLCYVLPLFKCFNISFT